ncbi:MAG: DegV family protein [uncultured Nocardioidaceae bacterium]|uniref:DegV family protein n=1 Tax=uncultured Nocardioidaceae bacterium TaxID=253824 RepID=A0A6J4LYD0_9ACTN|nr:MAG: DegV family protein [uncultured Nocardioidaceae bacterium]
MPLGFLLPHVTVPRERNSRMANADQGTAAPRATWWDVAMPRIVVVTDSTASLAPEMTDARGIVVVPLQLVVGDRTLDEDPADSAGTVTNALKERRQVSTSRPSPELMLDAYERAAAQGAGEVVSVHLSSRLSGTFESAELAARRSPVPVHPVDTGQLGMGTGFAVLAAAQARDAGLDGVSVAAAARTRAEATRSLFYVDTLEHLRRGGRIGAARSLLGSVLAVKPLLTISAGAVVPLDKARTSTRALQRLVELAVAAAQEAGAPVDVAVQHLASGQRAEGVADRLRERLQLTEVEVSEVGGVLGAHVGPGMVAVVVAPRWEQPTD